MIANGGEGLGQWRSRHLVLVGEMATGKTTVGRLLADLVGRAHVDSDELLEERIGVSGASFAGSSGVDALHDLELEILLEAISRADKAIISPAASVIDSEVGREALLHHVVVWLDAPAQVSLGRIGEGDHRRKVGLSEVERLRRRRHRHYRTVADLHIDTQRSEPKELAREIADALPGFR